MSNNQYYQGQNPRYSVSVEPNNQQSAYPVQGAPGTLDPKENEFRAKVKALIDSREDLKVQHKELSEKNESLSSDNSVLNAELEKYKTLLAENKLVLDEMMKENQRRQAAASFGAPMYAQTTPTPSFTPPPMPMQQPAVQQPVVQYVYVPQQVVPQQPIQQPAPQYNPYGQQYAPMQAQPMQAPQPVQMQSPAPMQSGVIGDLCGQLNEILADLYQRITALEQGRRW